MGFCELPDAPRNRNLIQYLRQIKTLLATMDCSLDQVRCAAAGTPTGNFAALFPCATVPCGAIVVETDTPPVVWVWNGSNWVTPLALTTNSSPNYASVSFNGEDSPPNISCPLTASYTTVAGVAGVTLTVTGNRKVAVRASLYMAQPGTNSEYAIRLWNDTSSSVIPANFYSAAGENEFQTPSPIGSVNLQGIDDPGPGTYTYRFQTRTTATSGDLWIYSYALVAYEIGVR